MRRKKKRGPAKDKKTRIPKNIWAAQKDPEGLNLDLSNEYLNFTRGKNCSPVLNKTKSCFRKKKKKRARKKS